jgi:putative flippase GtrA
LTSSRNALFVQFISYAYAGAVGTFAHYLTLFVLVEAFSVHPVVASAQGLFTGAVVNYLLNYHWVFRSKRRHVDAMTRFLAIAGVGLALNTIFMHLMVTLAGIHYLLSQIVATGAVLVWNFLGNRFWTFADEPNKRK